MPPYRTLIGLTFQKIYAMRFSFIPQIVLPCFAQGHLGQCVRRDFVPPSCTLIGLAFQKIYAMRFSFLAFMSSACLARSDCASAVLRAALSHFNVAYLSKNLRYAFFLFSLYVLCVPCPLGLKAKEDNPKGLNFLKGACLKVW